MRKVNAQMRTIVNWFDTYSQLNTMIGACQEQAKPLTLICPMQTQ